jgi:hypothetical protein
MSGCKRLLWAIDPESFYWFIKTECIKKERSSDTMEKSRKKDGFSEYG